MRERDIELDGLSEATFERMMAALAVRHDRLEEMLTRLGWPLPGHLGSRWLDDVAQLFLDGRATQEEVEEAILRNYRVHGLNDIRRSWQVDGLIAVRLPILLDALKAHEDGQFNLSVPVVLSQLEGMVAEARQHKGRFSRKALVEYLKPIAIGGEPLHPLDDLGPQVLRDALRVELQILPPPSDALELAHRQGASLVASARAWFRQGGKCGHLFPRTAS